MSKKRKKRKRQQRYVSEYAYRAKDKHHICYIKNKWSKGYAKAVRNFWYCIIPLEVGLHREIHHQITFIPLPSDQAAKEAYMQLIMLDKYGSLHETDSLELRINVLASLFDYSAQPTADALRKQLDCVKGAS